MSVPFWLWWNTLIPPSGLKTAAWSVLGPQWWCSWFCIKGEYDQGKGGAPKPMSKQEFNVGLVVPKFLTHNICAALANSCLVKMATRHKCDEEHFGYHNHCDPHHHGHHHHRHQPEGKTTSALTTSLTPQRPNSTWNCHFVSIQHHCHCHHHHEVAQITSNYIFVRNLPGIQLAAFAEHTQPAITTLPGCPKFPISNYNFDPLDNLAISRLKL